MKIGQNVQPLMLGRRRTDRQTEVGRWNAANYWPAVRLSGSEAREIWRYM